MLPSQAVDLCPVPQAVGDFDCRAEMRAPPGFARASVRRFTNAAILFVDLAHAAVQIEPRRRAAIFVPLDGAVACRVSTGRQCIAAAAAPMLLPPGLGLSVEADMAGSAIALFDVDLELLIERSGDRPADGGAALRRRLSGSEPRYLRPSIGVGGRDQFLVALLRAVHALPSRTGEPVYPELETCLLKAVRDGLDPLVEPAGARRDERGGDARIRQLRTFALERLTSELKLEDLAGETGLSTRMIQYLFQRHFGTSPKQWIIEQRLLAVRGRLCQPGAGDTVTSIAIPFFNNLGDFARRYRQRFGEKPSETLARARQRG